MRVRFIKSIKDNIYELVFGVLAVEKGNLNQDISTNNQDTNKIINTVYMILCSFSEGKNNIIIRYSGGSKSRTRLFNIWVNNNITMIKKIYQLWLDR